MKRWMYLTFSGICLLLMLSISSAQQTGNGYIKGTILTMDGGTLSGGEVCFYEVDKGPSPFSNKFWRDCDQSARIGDDGSFTAEIPEGTYYVMATKKPSGERPGPPIEVGDLIWPPRDGSEMKPYVLRSQETTDIGMVTGAVAFKKEWLVTGETGIEGRVLLEDGTPAEGVLVLASGDSEMRELIFVSDRRTGTDGKYIVRVEEDGEYYIRARGSKKPILTATVKSGEITKGIDIRVKENPGRRWDKPSKEKKDK